MSESQNGIVVKNVPGNYSGERTNCKETKMPNTRERRIFWDTEGEPIERDEFLSIELSRDHLIGEGLLTLQGGSMLIGGEAGIGTVVNERNWDTY